MPVSSFPRFKVPNLRCRRYTAWLDKTSAALARRFYSIYPDAQCSPPWVVAVLSQANLYLFFGASVWWFFEKTYFPVGTEGWKA